MSATEYLLDIPTAPVFRPLLEPSRYKGAYGGRGSGKSWFFAGLMVEECLRHPGLRGVCIREVQQSLKESAKRLIEDSIRKMQVESRFRILTDRIETPGDGVLIFQGMADHTADSIKSLEGFDRAWVEEAQTLSRHSLKLLRPTIRAPGSELWFSWNPRSKEDPVDAMFRGAEPPTGAVSVHANWSDNPWFPKELEAERQDMLRADPDQYDHVWEGGYVTVAEGAYFARELTAARKEGRIGRVSRDPLLPVRLFWDIGGAGSAADATAIWAAQFVGAEIRMLAYYEAQGQPMEVHLDWLARNGYGPGRTQCVLPHDGSTSDRIVAVTAEGMLRKAGYEVRVIPNQGRGAAMRRIEALRSRFGAMRFDEERCKGGIAALGWYHERRDEYRGIGLGPDHDWSSHGCDAAGLLAIAYVAPSVNQERVMMPPPIRAIMGGGLRRG